MFIYVYILTVRNKKTIWSNSHMSKTPSVLLVCLDLFHSDFLDFGLLTGCMMSSNNPFFIPWFIHLLTGFTLQVLHFQIATTTLIAAQCQTLFQRCEEIRNIAIPIHSVMSFDMNMHFFCATFRPVCPTTWLDFFPKCFKSLRVWWLNYVWSCSADSNPHI